MNMFIAKQFRLTRTRTLALLSELDEYDTSAITLYLPSGMPLNEVQFYLKQIQVLEPAEPDLSKNIVLSRTGAVILWGQTHKLLILPSFPVTDSYFTSGYNMNPLQSMLMNNYYIGIVLVRLGSYSIGICEGEILISHKTGTGLIHSRHRQGGSSAARFQRRRQDQTHHFLERVGEHARELLGPYARTLDYFIYGGAQTTIQQLQKQCDYFQQFNDRLLPPLLEIADPRFNILEKAVTQIWSSRVIEWQEIKINN